MHSEKRNDYKTCKCICRIVFYKLIFLHIDLNAIKIKNICL